MYKKFVYASDRAYVLEKMISLGLDIEKIFAVKGSYLERYLDKNGIEFETIRDKKTLISMINETDFDLFVSNGLPIILPISELKKTTRAEFVNIHPSLLPDLRGASPVPGALLFGRDSGATCHYMDDGIDTGDIIAQVRISNTSDLDAGLLYQLSFRAEADVFEKAYEQSFVPLYSQQKKDENIYYSISESDMDADIRNDSIDEIFRRVKAFSTRSKGVNLNLGSRIVKVYQVDEIVNDYAMELMKRCNNFQIMFEYENFIIVRKDDYCLRFRTM